MGDLRLRVLVGNLRPHDYYSAAAATALLASSICFNSSAFRLVGAMSISILVESTRKSEWRLVKVAYG